MLIPSIDLQGGQIVQLVQGERLAVATSDVDGRVRKFERFPKIQLIFGEFLFTNVDVEGLMQGIDRDAIAAVRDATTRDVTAAGASRRRKRSTDSTASEWTPWRAHS
jgi:phosphoribosylformimino-5-aminoimidazole carboxamide ribonucleotide (ProFAR) isomerase